VLFYIPEFKSEEKDRKSVGLNYIRKVGEKMVARGVGTLRDVKSAVEGREKEKAYVDIKLFCAKYKLVTKEVDFSTLCLTCSRALSTLVLIIDLIYYIIYKSAEKWIEQSEQDAIKDPAIK
jgi:hypothetical protein